MNIKIPEKQKIKILNSDDVFEIMQKVLRRENRIDRDKEHFWIIGLNSKNKILFIELVSIGGVRTSPVEPMNVFRVAVSKGAVKIILVHNHPSGELRPSRDDQDITDRLIQVGNILAIEVFDHLIISLKSYLSLKDIGLLSQLRESMKWMAPYEIVKKIGKEAKKIRKEEVKIAEEKGKVKGRKEGLKEGEKKGVKIGEDRGLRKGKIEIAKEMKNDEKATKEIIKYTRLSKKQIEEL
jgi:DNA repair protein RadC